MTRHKPYDAIHNQDKTMSEIEPEGIGKRPNQYNGRIEPPTEAEMEAIYEEFEEVVQTTNRHSSKCIHLINGGEEAICIEFHGGHGIENWQNPKPIEAFPMGYRPVCLYCIDTWRARRAE